MFRGLTGKTGNMVYYSRQGRLCARSYVIPRNPDTPAQKLNRRTFARAVKEWRELPGGVKRMFNKRACGKPYSGYNLFISGYLKGDASLNRQPVINPGIPAAGRLSAPLMLRDCFRRVRLFYYQAYEQGGCPGIPARTHFLLEISRE
ncbi:MAG TPA: hypothetical protein PK514_02290 [Spirochaetota bacterium]|nr:hypothetical protein [Spirochaetota bacterium]